MSEVKTFANKDYFGCIGASLQELVAEIQTLGEILPPHVVDTFSSAV